NGWNTAAVSTTLSAHTKYWLVYWTNNNVSNSNNAQYFDATGGTTYFFDDTTCTPGTWPCGSSNGMPTTFPTAGGTSLAGYNFSIYASFTATTASPVVVTSAGQLNVVGPALFESSLPSTTAFQLQDPFGTNLFVADTANEAIGIGTGGN